MQTERGPDARRQVARHELALRDPRAVSDDPLPRLALACDRLSQPLTAALARYMPGGDLVVTAAAPTTGTLAAPNSASPCPLDVHGLFGVSGEETRFLASIDGRLVLSLVDRAYGGRGVVPATLPRAYPPSAELLIERVSLLLADTLAQAFGLGADAPIRPLRRDTSLTRLAPFEPDVTLSRIDLTLREGTGREWVIGLAFPAATLAALLPLKGALTAPARCARSTAADTVALPFADITLTLRAVLVDMRMPLSRLATLAVDDVLPLAVARSVPIDIAGRTIAHGIVGAIDDRAAVQLTRAFT